MMVIGYARCSLLEPESDLEEQRRVLAGFGAAKVFVDRGTPTGPRPMLNQCLAMLREGDVLAVARPDRLCCSAKRLLEIEGRLRKRGVALVVGGLGGQVLDIPAPPLLGRCWACSAASRHGRGLSWWRRISPGSMRRRRRGAFKGTTKTRISARMVEELARMGVRPRAIARQMGIGKTSVYRLLPPGYRVTFPPPPVRKGRIDGQTVRLLSESMGPSKIAAMMGISRSSVRRLRDG